MCFLACVYTYRHVLPNLDVCVHICMCVCLLNVNFCMHMHMHVLPNANVCISYLWQLKGLCAVTLGHIVMSKD